MTILETVIAATLISVALVASLRLSTNTQKEATYTRDFSLATKYNYQTFDWLKSVKAELGWAEFAGKLAGDGGSALYCVSVIPDTSLSFLTLPDTTKAACAGTPIPGTTNFYRTVEIVLDGGGEQANLIAKTYWQGKAEHSVSAETHLTNY